MAYTVSLVIGLAVVLTLAEAPVASAIPTVRVTSGGVGSGASLSGIDVCYSILGAGFGCSLTGDADLPVRGATTYTVPLNLNFDTDTYASLTFQHPPLCAWDPEGCLGLASFGIPWEDSVRFTMIGGWNCETLEPCIPSPDVEGFRLIGVGTLHGSGDGLTEWFYSYDFAPSVPEPSTLLLLGSALGGLGVMARVTRRTP